MAKEIDIAERDRRRRAAWDAARSASPLLPRRVPRSLPGEFWGITSHFNPAGYGNKLENLERFSRRVRSQGIKLLVVELAFRDDPFEIPDGLADRIERRRTNSVLWQKERLLNIGIQCLPDGCDKVAWIDGDVMFENDDWVIESAAALESYVIVQPFESAVWLREGEQTAPPTETLGFGNQEGTALPGFGYSMYTAADHHETLVSYFTHGHCGFAWAARREVLDRHGLYDCQILGGGDLAIAHAMFGSRDLWEGRLWECDRLSAALLSHLVEWSRPFYEDVRGSVFYVPGRVVHFWHGNQSDRQYNRRLSVLKDCDFDPRTDLVLDDNGCWTWGSDKPELHAWAAGYFTSRQEGSTSGGSSK